MRKYFIDLAKAKKLQVDLSKFYLEMEIIDNLSDGYLKDFKKRLVEHPKYETIKNNYIIDEDNNTLVYILEKIPLDKVKDLTEDERFFYPMCNKNEIKRIFNVKSTGDYLLKFRAEQIANDIRLHRVLTSIRQKSKKWNFSQYFHSNLFDYYKNTLPNNEKILCNNLTSGTIFLKDANGYCMKTPYGNIIVISFSLRYFLYYMNLYNFGSQLNISNEAIFHSFLIAMRTMLGTEALDFEIDSRGEIPKKAHEQIKNETNWQMLFVIGHEFAHHYLNHLDKASIKLLRLKENATLNTPFYNYKQKLELEADYYAIATPLIDDNDRTKLANGAFYFFLWLDLYECVEYYIFPPSSKFRTHPKPIERIWELRNRLDKKYGLTKKELTVLIKESEPFKKSLIEEYLPFNIDFLEKYASVYLPGYKKEIKYDRLFF